MRRPQIMALLSALLISISSQNLLQQLLKEQDQKQLLTKPYCELYKYPVQEHKISTEDGYILTYYRLQKKNQAEFKEGLPVMYLQHGFVDSSDSWIVNSRPIDDLAPAFYFANRGFDVWLGNMRGNYYSREHHSLSANDKQFWEFSFDEMARYDLTAAFQYIHNTTLQKINYIGHSQGTMVMFIALIQNNQVVKQLLNNYAAFAPVAFVAHQTSILLTIAVKLKLASFLKFFKIYEVFQFYGITSRFQSLVCQYFPSICKSGIQLLGDMKTEEDNEQRLSVFTGHFPKGSSLQNLEHFAQLYDSKSFQMFDYGRQKNQQKYGQKTVPQYDFSKMEFNKTIHLYTGLEDRIGDMADVARLNSRIDHSKINVHNRYLEGFGHFTFYLGKSNYHLDYVLADFGYSVDKQI